jgi:YD repeat-containing protein
MQYNTNGYLTNLIGSVSNATTRFTYDAYGRVRATTESAGYTLMFDYDYLGRVTQVTYPDGTYSQVVYDKLDAALSHDRRGNWTRSTYNAVRQLTSVQDALGRLTSFDWCSCGALESLTDPLGRVTAKIYPDATQTTYAYENSTGRLRTMTDANGQQTWYEYFADNNLKRMSYSNAVVSTAEVNFTYDTNYNGLDGRVGRCAESPTKIENDWSLPRLRPSAAAPRTAVRRFRPSAREKRSMLRCKPFLSSMMKRICGGPSSARWHEAITAWWRRPMETKVCTSRALTCQI